MTRCRSQCPDLWTVECELPAGHDGQHRNNMVRWNEPQLVIVGDELADTATETDHWQDGDVRFSWEEPRL